MIAADLDDDGDIDLVSASVLSGSSAVVWHENIGGQPTQYIDHLISDAMDDARNVLAVDIDEDGDIDVLSATSHGTFWHENLGGSPVAFAHHTLLANESLDLAAADLDGDSDPDIMVAEPNWVRLLKSNGAPDPQFTAVNLGGSAPYSVDLGDADGDGDIDGLVNDLGDGVRLYRNTGGPNPSFSPQAILSPFYQVTSARFVDTNQDTHLDILITSGLDFVLCYVNNGAANPTFIETGVSVATELPVDAHATDIDGDGDPDVIIGYAHSTIGWVENVNGAFDYMSDPIPLATGIGGVRTVTSADIDGDTDIDVLAASNGSLGLTGITQFERAEVLNLTTMQKSNLLHQAIDGAAPGDTLLATPAHFSRLFAPQVDLQGKSLTLRSRGPLLRPGATTTVLADGAALESAPGMPVSIEGALHVPDIANIALIGTPVRVTGDIAVGLFSAIALGPDAELAGVPAFQETFVSSEVWFPQDVQAGDINGDGHIDLVTAWSDDVIAWYENNGDPVPQFTKHIVIDLENAFLQRLSLGDLDGDGDLDIAYVFTQVGGVRWLENIGNTPTQFVDRAIPNSRSGCRVVVCADMNGDDRSDLVINGNGIYWFENTGGVPPQFVERPLDVSQGAVGYATGDIDDDGDVDLIAASSSPGGEGMYWYINNGADPPSFTPFFADALGAYYSVRIADLDDDGDLDALAASNFDIAWFENTGTLPYPRHSIAATNGREIALAATDLDNDGDIDPISASLFENTVAWYPNDGASDPQFDARLISSTAVSAYTVIAADIDGDGDEDVVSTDKITFDDFAIQWHRNLLQNDLVLNTITSLNSTGDIRLRNRTLIFDFSVEVNAATSISVDIASAISGSGVLRAPLVQSAGLMEPLGEGTLTIDGSYSQSFDDGIVGDRAGVLRFEIGELGIPSGELSITGQATLDGILVTSSLAPLDPQFFQPPLLLSAASIAPGSRFDVALLPNAGSTAFLSVVYEEGGLRAGERGEIDRALATVSLQVNSLTGDIDLDPQAGAESGAAGVPRGATLGDIDGDGDPDLLIALPDAASPNTAPGSVVVLYNADDGNAGNGWEGFGDTLQITAGVGVNPSSVALGAIDADGQPDIVVSNRGTPGNTANDSVSVLLIDDPSAATFALSHTTSFTVGDEPADIIIADLDGDGALDIATANAGSDSVTIAWNFAIGVGPGWVPVTTQPIELPEDDETPVSVRPGDTNAEVFSFLATANSGNNTIGLIQVNPDRSAAVLPNTPAGAGPVEVVVADLNLDGDDDIATVNRNDSSITIVLNTTALSPTLTVGAPSDLPVPTTTSLPRSIAAGDFDNDANGDIDLAILGDGVIKILRNDLFNGQLAFTPIADQPAGVSPLLVRSADLNGDGRDDVVTVAESAGALSLQPSAIADAPRMAPAINILLADLGAPACAADINGDGFTNASDFVILAGNFGASVTPNTDGDLNGDGLVNAADFVILAGDFGCGN